MANDLGAKAKAAFQDIADQMDQWTQAVSDRVKENLDAAQAKNDLSPTDVARWSVEAVQFLLDGAKRMGEAVLDGVAQFDAAPADGPLSTAGGSPGPGQEDRTFDITNSGPVPSPLTLTLTGLRSGTALDSALVVLQPSVVPRGPVTVKVKVTVDLTGLDDIYVGRLTGGPSITPQPGVTFGHRVI